MVTKEKVHKHIRTEAFQKGLAMVNRIKKKVKRNHPKYTYKAINRAIGKATNYNIDSEKDAYHMIVQILEGGL